MLRPQIDRTWRRTVVGVAAMEAPSEKIVTMLIMMTMIMMMTIVMMIRIRIRILINTRIRLVASG